MLTGKILAGILLFLLVLFVLVKFIILIPSVQNILKNKVASVLIEKLHTDVNIGKIDIRFPQKVAVSDFFIAGNKNDTLIYIGDFAVSARIFPLLKHRIVLSEIELKESKGDFGRLIEQIPSEPETPETEQTESNPWEIDINALRLENSYFKYRDNSAEGFELILDFGKVYAKIGYINFDTLIRFSYLETENSFASYQELGTIESDEDTTFSFADIRVDKTDLQNSAFSYIDSIGGVIVNVKGDEVKANDVLVDITRDTVSIDEGWGNQVFVETLLLPEEDTLPETYDYLNWGESLSDWFIKGNRLNVKDSRVKVDFTETPNPRGHLNSDHLDFNHLTGTLANFKLAIDILDAEIKNLTGIEMNGLEVLQLDADIKTTPSEFQIKTLNLKTPAADYDIKLLTTLSPTNYLDIENKTLDLTIGIDGKTWHDMDYFYPFLEGSSIFTKDFSNIPFQLKTKITGKTEDLILEQFYLKYLAATHLQANGELINITNPDLQEFKLDLKNLYVTKNDIENSFIRFFPDSVFTFPDFLKLTGKATGKVSKLQFAGTLSSSNGSIIFNQLQADLGENQEYAADISVDLQNLDEIIHYDVDQIKLDLDGSFNGADIYTSSGTINLTIDTLTYLNHAYNKIDLSGELTNGDFRADFNSQDSSVMFSAYISSGYHENNKNSKLTLDIQNLDLKELNLFTEDFRMEGNTEVTTDFVSLDYFNASLNLSDLNFYFSDTIYRMHPIAVNLSSDETTTRFNLESFFYHLDFNSEGSWKKMANGIANLPDLYLKSEHNDTIKNTIPDFNLNGKLEYPAALARLFFPELPSFKSLSINGNYSKTTDKLNFGFIVPGVQTDDFSSDSILFNLNGDSRQLQFNGLAMINFNNALKGSMNLSGDISDSELNSSIRYFDSYAGKYMDINTLFWADSSNYRIHFIPDSLTFSYDKWQINPDNLITIGKDKISFSDFNVQSENQKITISSGVENNYDFVRLQLQDFGMGSIENLMALDTLVYGTANADFTFLNLFTHPEIDGSLSINNINISDFDFGKFDISSFNYRNNELSYALSLKGVKEDIQSSGTLNFVPGNEQMNIDFNINQLDLKELDYILEDKVSNPKGNLEASLKLSGTTESPLINGNIGFTDAGVGIKLLNEYFTLGNTPVTIENNVVQFNNLAITNQNGRNAHINGTVSLDQKNRGMQNLTITTDNMELLNTKEKDNNLYYGMLKAQTDFHLTGTSDALKVDARTKIDKNTSLTYVFPDVLTLEDSKGIVSFDPYDADSVDLNFYSEQNDKLKGLALESLKANVEVESGTRFKIYFDESKTDFLDAVLNGNINYILDGDNSDISGAMSIVEGKLRYSLPMVSVEDYTIEPGSSITISNDVYNPYLNVVASTSVRASTEKLIPSYVKVMNFTVLLKMTGELNNVKLSFDISSETDDVIVSSKLAQLSAEERNVNALNLLVRGSFTLSIKGDEVGSASSSDAAIDKFYTEQLNHLISENINFVDVNFDVQSFSDYGNYGETIHRRNYYYNIGKSFFNNRARINYKGSFDFADGQETQSLNTQFLQNELNLEIGLTNDGALKALFFNRNKYEGILEGKVMETGGGLKLQKSFYSIGDIFDGNPARKEKRKENKEEKQKNQDTENKK